jgi:hypothetical protein
VEKGRGEESGRMLFLSRAAVESLLSLPKNARDRLGPGVSIDP